MYRTAELPTGGTLYIRDDKAPTICGMEVLNVFIMNPTVKTLVDVCEYSHPYAQSWVDVEDISLNLDTTTVQSLINQTPEQRTSYYIIFDGETNIALLFNKKSKLLATTHLTHINDDDMFDLVTEVLSDQADIDLKNPEYPAINNGESICMWEVYQHETVQ